MADNKFGVIDNVTFAYAKIAEATKKFESEDTTYEVDCIVSKAQAKAWSKEFTKQKAKEYDRDDFIKRFKMDPPYEGDEIYVIKMRKAASKDGEVYDEAYRPKVLLDTNDGERVEITTSRLISNGSKGKISYRITENSFGKFGQLNNILMSEDDFIEYKSLGGQAGSEFGDAKPVRSEPAKESVTKARANKDAPAEVEKKAKPMKPAVEDDADEIDGAPF